MKTFFAAVLSALVLFGASVGGAQVTLDQLDQAMQAEGDAMEAFRIRLQDPDPVKARAAMRLLIAQGDDAQRRLAIAHGFEATDPAMRLQAVRGIFDAEPLLLFRLAPEKREVNNNFRNVIIRFSGDFEEGGVARIPVKITGFSTEKNCWTLENGYCFARFNSGELSIAISGKWAQFSLDRDGRLVGRPDVAGYRVDAVADLTQ